MKYYFLTCRFEDTVLPKLKRISNKCKDFKYEILGEEMKEISETASYKYTVVEVEGKGFASNENYQLAAMLEHSIFGNIVKPINKNIEVPTKYRTAKCSCEHCNINRERKTTFLLKNVHTGEFKQVGKSCLKEFNGINPEVVLNFYNLKDEYDTWLESGEARAKAYASIPAVIKISKYIIDRVGYMKKVDNRRCTASVVANVITKSDMFLRKDLEALNKNVLNELNELKFKEITCFNSEPTEETQKIVDYWLSLPNTSDFINNIQIFIKEGCVKLKNLGYVCYIYEGYRKHLEELEKIEKRKMPTGNITDYMEIGKRHTIDINNDIDSITIAASFETEYGVTHIHKIKLYNGAEFTWFTNKFIKEIPAGKSKFSFTIKDIKDYKGEEQIIITRGMFKK